MHSELTELARVFAKAVIRQWVPAFRGTLHLDGRGLVVTSAEQGWGIVVPPRREGAEAGVLVERTPAVVGTVGAMAALTAAIVMHRSPSEAPVLLEPDTVHGASSGAPPEESLGFLALRRGWIGLAAVGKDQHRLIRSLLDDGLAERPPPAAASTLQSFGIASMPAPTAEPRRNPLRDDSRPQIAVSGVPPLPPILRGVHVVDFGRLVAAPFAVDLLIQLGAEVSRIRPPGCGERWGAGEEVDLRSSDGRARVRALVADADVLVENFSHRAGARLADLLGPHMPRHVVAVRGFRATSPCAHWRVLGFLAQAALGVGPVPGRNAGRHWVPAPSEPVWDRVAGTVAAATVVSKLVDHSQFDTPRPSWEAVPLVELAVMLARSRAELAGAA